MAPIAEGKKRELEAARHAGFQDTSAEGGNARRFGELRNSDKKMTT
jgi:hypothetical protein